LALPFLAALGLAEAAPLKLDFSNFAAPITTDWIAVRGNTTADTMVNETAVGGTQYNFSFDHVACWDNGQSAQSLTRSGFYNFGQLTNTHGFVLSGLNPGQSVKLYACAGWDGNGRAGTVVFGDNAPNGVKALTVGLPGTAPTLANLTYIGNAVADGTGTVTGSLHGVDGVGTNTEGQVGGFYFFPAPTIVATAGANGSISPSGPAEVPGGDDQTYTITANSGHHIADVLVDGVSVGAVTSYTFNDVAVDHTISASFAVNTTTHTITATAGAHGTISPSGSVSANTGVSTPFTITPDTGYHIVDVLVDGVSIGPVTNHTISNITASHTISASFAINTYTITATAGDNGSISPAGATVKNHGESLLYTFTPAPGYQVAEVFVDGVAVDDLNDYSFDEISANHTISATFDNRTRLYLDFTQFGGSYASTWTPVSATMLGHSQVASVNDINGLGYGFSITNVGAYDNNRPWEPLIRSGFYTVGNQTNEHNFTLTGLNAGQTVALYASAAWDGNAAGGHVIFGDSGPGGVKAQTVGEPGPVPVIGNMTLIGTAVADAAGTVTGSLHGRNGVGPAAYDEGQVGGFVFAISPGGIPLSPFAAWAGGPPNNLSGSDALPGADPDHDGVSNLLEFALNGSPTSGASTGRAFAKMATVDAVANVLTLTVAVRDGANFSPDGNRMVSAGIDGVTYTIEASSNLGSWGDRAVTEVTGDDAFVIQTGLPTLDAGWAYMTFRSAGSAGTNAGGFIRASVE
jgi:hypothetical protein